MRSEKPTWFWLVTTSIVLAWAIAGTLAIILILNGEIYVGEAIIIATTIMLVVFYHLAEWLKERR